jgi:hypothetical protein
VRPDPPAVAPFFPHGAVTHVSVDPFPLGLPPRHVGPGRHDVWSVPRHSRAALAACHLPHRAHLVAAIADMRRLPPGTPKPTRSVPTVHAFGSILPAPATPRSPRCSPVRSSAHARWPPRRRPHACRSFWPCQLVRPPSFRALYKTDPRPSVSAPSPTRVALR